eukprot:2440560-Pleurochrysis_carterae.AAC.2
MPSWSDAFLPFVETKKDRDRDREGSARTKEKGGRGLLKPTFWERGHAAPSTSTSRRLSFCPPRRPPPLPSS